MSLEITVNFLGADSNYQSVQGDTVRIGLECRDFEDVLTDPSELLIRVYRESDEDTTEYEFAPDSESSASDSDDEFTHSGVGLLEFYLLLAEGGLYRLRVEAVVGGLDMAAQTQIYAAPEDPDSESSSSSSS